METRTNRAVAILAALVLTTALFPVQAAGIQDISDRFFSGKTNMINAAMNYRKASPEDALVSLTAAQSDLSAILTYLEDPAIVALLGGNLNPLIAKVRACTNAVDKVSVLVDPDSGLKAMPANAVLSQLFAAAKLVRTSGDAVTKLILSGKLPGSDKVI
ncbi:MAG: hypothetical protein MUC65_10170, partial [Pontiellaceae bacterium]|nr:hypothetical protein [Pontiellaceae bacterium]